MRRGILTVALWVGISLIFVLHLIVTYQKDFSHRLGDAVSERSFRQVRTTILERTEQVNSDETETPKQKQAKEALGTKLDVLEKSEQFDRNVEALRKELVNMKIKEKQLKSLVRKLTAHVKDIRAKSSVPRIDPEMPWVFAITPTYTRFTQKADLVRLSQTLMLVTNLHWIVVEDSEKRTDLVSRLLKESGLRFTHLNVRTPTEHQRKKWEARKKHHRGVQQRNLALDWLRENVNSSKTPGAVYFMDDDNTYHIKIFDEMRWTHGVSMWPVGLAGAARYSGPIVQNGKVVRFHTNWAQTRKFPVDMAGFAVGLKVLLEEYPNVVFNSSAQRGFLEPTFLEQITSKEQVEPLAGNCTKVYVWHTRTETPKDSIKGERQLIKQGNPSDPNIEV